MLFDFFLKVKKTKKWACKVCGEKQSVKKVYAQGSGQDCRKHVQKLNLMCGEAQQAENLYYGSTEGLDFCKVSDNANIIATVKDSQMTHHEDHTGFSKGESKWEKFLDINSCDDIGKFRFLNFILSKRKKLQTPSLSLL